MLSYPIPVYLFATKFQPQSLNLFSATIDMNQSIFHWQFSKSELKKGGGMTMKKYIFLKNKLSNSLYQLIYVFLKQNIPCEVNVTSTEMKPVQLWSSLEA